MAYRTHVRSRLADVPPPPENHPSVTRVASPRRIPSSGVIATDTFNKGPEFVRTAHDVDDAIVKAAPEMFRDLDGGHFGAPKGRRRNRPPHERIGADD